MNPVAEIIANTLEKDKQAIIFCASKRAAEKQAEDLAKIKSFNLFSEQREILAKDFETKLSQPTKQCLRNGGCIRNGFAFHHAGLTSSQKSLVEDSFRNGLVKVICATPTLAAGVDLPAFRTILKDLKRYSGKWGMQYIPVLEYEQMAGRAGRPGMEEYGEAIAIATTENDKISILENYIKGEVEGIQSKLAVEPVLRVHVLSLISSNFANDYDSLINFFSKTFYAKQFGDFERVKDIVMGVVDLLVDYGFVETTGSDNVFKSANELSGGKLFATQIGKRVSELYLDPLTANHLIKSLEKASENFELVEEKSFLFLQAISNTIEMQPLLYVKSKEMEEMHSTLAEFEPQFFTKVPTGFEFDDYLNSIKTALFFKSWINEESEESLLEKFSVRPGETRAKLDVADWLLRCCADLAKLKGYFNLVSYLSNLRVRVKSGAKAELLPLLKLKNVGRVRARKMFSSGLTSIKDLKNKQSVLHTVLGTKLAKDVLNQIGVEEYKGRSVHPVDVNIRMFR